MRLLPGLLFNALPSVVALVGLIPLSAVIDARLAHDPAPRPHVSNGDAA